MTQLQLACETDGQTQARGPGVKRGSYGNCRAVETVEKRTACFSTVPTALGKLGKKTTTPSFPQFPQLRRLGLYIGEEETYVSSTVAPLSTNRQEPGWRLKVKPEGWLPEPRKAAGKGEVCS
jgi:hypothetical protein